MTPDPRPPQPVAIVLDFDGTIVQSMERHAESYRRVLAPHKIDVKDAEVFEWEGARSETIIANYLRLQGLDAPDRIRRLANEKQEIFKSLGPAPLYAGARTLVQTLRKGVPRLGLVTGTRRENLERLIPDLLPLFDAVLAQDAYSNDKPHPEPYANAAQRLGVPAARCAALENAPRGVKSALAAGYETVVALATTVSASALKAAGASIVARDHDEAGRRLLDWARARLAPSGAPRT